MCGDRGLLNNNYNYLGRAPPPHILQYARWVSRPASTRHAHCSAYLLMWYATSMVLVAQNSKPGDNARKGPETGLLDCYFISLYCHKQAQSRRHLSKRLGAAYCAVRAPFRTFREIDGIFHFWPKDLSPITGWKIKAPILI